MAGDPKKVNKQMIYVAIIVAMIGSTAFLLYRNFAQEPTVLPPATVAQPDAALSGEVRVDSFTRFQSPEALQQYLDKLVRFGAWPVQLAPATDPSRELEGFGRSNPFLPL